MSDTAANCDRALNEPKMGFGKVSLSTCCLVFYSSKSPRISSRISNVSKPSSVIKFIIIALKLLQHVLFPFQDTSPAASLL